MNISTYQHYPWQCDAECITLLTVMMIESVAIVTINVVTIIIIIKMRSLRRRSMYLVINLAVADMFVGGLSEVLILSEMGLNPWTNDVSQQLRRSLRSLKELFIAASMTNIVAISLERMHATIFPLRHRVIKKRIYVLTIAIVWLLAVGVPTLKLLLSLEEYVLYLLGCFGLFIVCVSYASIVVKIYCGAHPQHHGAASRERKLTVTLFIVTFASLGTWLPFVTYKLIALNLCTIVVEYRIEHALTVLYFANSLVNPILYAIRMPEFKRGLVLLFRCRPQQRQIVFPLRVM